jgi:hypothetical protein
MVPLTCDRALRRSAIDVTRQAYADGADVFSQSLTLLVPGIGARCLSSGSRD